MNKLEMAHEMALKIAGEGLSVDICVSLGWQYADAMQAESDKRKGFKQDGYVEPIKAVIVSHGEMKEMRERQFKLINNGCSEEWQPDWSQAPVGAMYWMMFSVGDYAWLDSGHKKINKSPSFGYQGSWKDSLRKRPEQAIESMHIDDLKKLSKSIENIQECDHEWDHVSAYGGTGDYYVCTCGAEKHSF